MYKVFLNDKVIILTTGFDLELMCNKMLYFRYDDFEEIYFIISLLEDHPGLKGVVIQDAALDELWADFRAHFREIDAAGGLVINDNSELLLINRLGKWDLPKGKHEDGESIAECALREVEEECGISGLVLGKPLPDTYHTYTLKGIRYLKRTHWFEMRGNQNVLTPQKEEGIVEAKWFAPQAIDWQHMPTYPNIKILVDQFKASH